MLKYTLSDYHWLYLMVIIFWTIAFFIIKAAMRYKARHKNINKHILYFFLIAVSFSFLGLTVGLLVGLSISPVIGVVIPALLTFFGGFITYVFIFGTKTVEKIYLMATIIISLSFFLILGADYGSAIRLEYEMELAIFKRDIARKDIEHEPPSSITNKFQKETTVDTVAKTGYKK